MLGGVYERGASRDMLGPSPNERLIGVARLSIVRLEDCAGWEAFGRTPRLRPNMMADAADKRDDHDALTAAGRVLIVDDQPELRRLVRRGLVKAGYVVVEAWNGRIAVELAQQLRFDVVISDVCMPDMSGIELLEALRELDPDLPVVLTSGSPAALDVAEPPELAAFAFLVKPVPVQTMCATATRAVQVRRARHAARESYEPYASVERLRVPRPDDRSDDDGER
jgi:CheY-like chemotaxis protein